MNPSNKDYWVLPSNSLVIPSNPYTIRKIYKNEGKVVAQRSLEDPLVLGVVKHFGWTVLDGPFGSRVPRARGPGWMLPRWQQPLRIALVSVTGPLIG